MNVFICTNPLVVTYKDRRTTKPCRNLLAVNLSRSVKIKSWCSFYSLCCSHSFDIKTSNDITGDVLNVPKNYRDNVVLLNPSAMCLCGLFIGKPCLVNEQYVLTAWPSSSLPPTGVGLPVQMMKILDLTKGDLTDVQPFTAEKQEAEVVHFKFRWVDNNSSESVNSARPKGQKSTPV